MIFYLSLVYFNFIKCTHFSQNSMKTCKFEKKMKRKTAVNVIIIIVCAMYV